MRKENILRLNRINIPDDHPDFLVYRSFHRALFYSLSKYSKGRVLDIGCGNKPYKSLIANQIVEYIGCDIVQSSDNCVDVICQAHDIPLPDSSFDTVISTQVIEHVENPQALIQEAFRLLKPGGIFIVSGPMYWPLHEEPYDFYRFTKYGFTHLITNSGFSVIEGIANGGKWAVVGQAFLHAFLEDYHKFKSWQGKLVRLIFRRIGKTKSVNAFFSRIDDNYYDEINTLNYVFIAKKIQ